MIDIKTLEAKDVGKFVEHTPTHKRGALAYWDGVFVFVVYPGAKNKLMASSPRNLVFVDTL